MTRLLSLFATAGLVVCVWLARPSTHSNSTRALRLAWCAGRWARRILRWARWRDQPLDVPRIRTVTDIEGDYAPTELDPEGDDTCGGGGWDPPCGGCDLCIVQQAKFYGHTLHERPVALVWRVREGAA